MDLLSALGLKKPSRVPLRGGGTFALPHRYQHFPTGDYRHRDGDIITAYRRWHSTMAGTNESNGMIAVANASRYDDLEAFFREARGHLTTRWSWSNESQGHWYGRPEKYPETRGTGANGPEIAGKLSVHIVGWTVYDAPGAAYAVHDRRGVMIAVWIFNKHGGEERARRYAERIAASFSPD